MFGWFKEISAGEKRTFWACFGGWALDALDVQMFSLVIPTIIAAWHIGKTEAGLVSGITLVASALGGWIAGAMTDRLGRVRTLQITVAWFSLATFASAFAQNFEQFLALKAVQGFGFGGEWAAGAVLMAESIRASHRGKAMGTVQSAWAVGWGAAVLLYALTYSLVEPDLAWRVMFAAGVLPALLIIYIRRGVQEPAPAGAKAEAGPDGMPVSRFPLFDIFRPRVLRMTLIGALLGVGAHGGYYALMTWLPTYLKTERHLSVLGTGGYLAVIIFAFWCGCVASAWLLDVIGRRGNILLFHAAAWSRCWCTCWCRCPTARCWCWASRSGSLPPASRPAWARCSTSSTRTACAAPAWASATTSAAWSRPPFRCWWAR